jgi:ribose transport system ATP-binding protein
LLKSLGLDLSPDTLVEKLAPGERQLVEITKAVSAGAEIIIFDEPATSLTAGETERLFGIIKNLKAQGKSIVYISHDLDDVLRLADDIVVIRDGEVVAVGSKEDFTVAKMISRMVGRDIDQIFPVRASNPSAEVVLAVKGLSQSGIVKDISFMLHKAEVLGLFGLMGSGRTELARILFGLDPFEEGQIRISGVHGNRMSASDSIGRGMAFVTENRREEGLLMEATVVDNIGLVALPTFAARRFPRLLRHRQMKEAVTRVAESMRIKGGPVDRTLAKNLSGGNQQKAVIGKWLMSRPAIFLMDEPTRGIDVGAKYEVYNIINDLVAEGGAILFISSELEELMGLCDRIIVMSKGEIQGCFRREEYDQERILRAAFEGHRAHRCGLH